MPRADREATSWPSGLNATGRPALKPSPSSLGSSASTGLVEPRAASRTFARRSPLEATSCLPSGLKATHLLPRGDVVQGDNARLLAVGLPCGGEVLAARAEGNAAAGAPQPAQLLSRRDDPEEHRALGAAAFIGKIQSSPGA